MATAKPILDACCGGRMMWHNKRQPGVVFMDCRTVEPTYLTNRQWFSVKPDVVGDYRTMPFPDDTFRMVVFDPPHLTRLTETAYMALKYGRLFDTWRDDLAHGFRECFRVLDPAGFLIFKWSGTRIPLAEVVDLADRSPMFGDRSGKNATHWLTFAGVTA